MAAPPPRKAAIDQSAIDQAAEKPQPARTSWDAQFQQLQNQFVNRAQERLIAIESLIVRLQTNSSDNNLLRQIRQHFHWLAGSASTYGFEEIRQWGTYGEELCDYLLNLQAPVSAMDIDKLATALRTVIQLF